MLSGTIFATYSTGTGDNGSPDTIGEYSTSGATTNPSIVSGLNEAVTVAVSGNDLFVANWGAFDNDTGYYDHATIDE